MLGLKKKIKQADRPQRLLLGVVSGEHLPDGRIDFVVDIEISGVKKRVPYTYEAGDPDPITVQLTDWLKRNAKIAAALPYRETVVTSEDVKREAARRIRLLVPRWKMERALTGGKPIPAADQKAAQAVRDASDRIEKMNPIPVDYTDDRYWS